MKILLLIDPKLSEKILSVKKDLYKEGFRIDGQTEPSTPPHITLAQATDLSISLETLKAKLDSVFEKYRSEEIKNFQIVNEIQGENSNWVALSISDDWLKNLSKDIEGILDDLGINRTPEYKKKIFEIRKNRNSRGEVNSDDCIADHLNLLNKCKKEFADKAVKSFEFLNDIDSIKPEKVIIYLS